MIKENDCVALTADLPEHRLTQGDVGAVVFVYDQSRGYEVEFVTYTGETVALVSLSPSQIRPLERGEIAHVRDLDHLEATADLS